MTPIFWGRHQTRLFLIGVVGTIWTLIITPIIPGFPSGTPLSIKYQVTMKAILVVLVVGLIWWENLYHFIMWFRWEKDWPFFLGFLTGFLEAPLAYFLLRDWVLPEEFMVNGSNLPVLPFVIHFASTWIITLVFANSFMRVLFPRWRFRGGKLIGGNLARSAPL